MEALGSLRDLLTHALDDGIHTKLATTLSGSFYTVREKVNTVAY